MIEQNYFKSSKDTGVLSTKQKQLAKNMGLSSRDNGAPRKERQIRRERKRAEVGNKLLSFDEDFFANDNEFTPENQLGVN
jgi:hypothetical protein